jgi:GTPase SAR1 family protein
MQVRDGCRVKLQLWDTAGQERLLMKIHMEESIFQFKVQKENSKINTFLFKL